MDNLQTGDLVLFGPNWYDIRPTLSWVIGRFITWNVCELTHCGIILKNMPEPGLFLLHCNYVGATFEYSITKFSDIVKQYEFIYVRKLNVERGLYFIDKMEKVLEYLRDSSRNGTIAKYITVTFEMKKNNPIIYPCSAFVAFIYICLGVFPFDFDWTIVTVDNLSTRQSGRILPWISEDVICKEITYSNK